MVVGAAITALLANWCWRHLLAGFVATPASTLLPASSNPSRSVAALLRLPPCRQTPAAPPAVAPTAAAIPDLSLPPVSVPTDPAEMKLSSLPVLAESDALSQLVPAKPAPPKKSAAAKNAPVQAAAQPAKAAADSVKRAPEPREAKPASLPAVASVSATGTEDAQIDKRMKGGQAREMADGEYRKAMQAVKRGDNTAAYPLFQRALELDPGQAKARQGLLSVLVGGRQAEARQVAQNGLASIHPDRWAAPSFEQAMRRRQSKGWRATPPCQWRCRYQGLHAYLLQKQQRPAEAVQRFQAALALRPNEGRWWFGLGLALEAAGHGGEAKEAYAKAKEVGNLPGDMMSVVEHKLR
jgi:MSHA biogenesis protein MshN